MRALPNMEVFIPADPIETSLVTEYLVQTKMPSYLRLGKSNEPDIHRVKPKLEYGKFIEVIGGESGTLLFIGSIGVIAELARAEILDKGYSVSVASVPFLSNLDKEYLLNAASKGPIITIEEHSTRGGFGSAILEFLNVENIPARVGMVSAKQHDLSLTGSQDYLRIANGLTSSNITVKFTELLEI
jgi:transketolase